ncbi:MAG: rod shape-determining protein RodA [Treponema sp.]|jgi:rod shape determining protein RodA|nr:rod shape-determining protein RodA [Treponema sp.]
MKARDFLEIDYLLLLAAIVLSIIGILFIYSSGISSTGEQISSEYVRQIIWAAAGLVIALVLAMLDYKKLYELSLYLYLATLALLVYTYFFGRVVNGSRSWLGIGVVGIQPAEFAKITTIFFLARYLDMSRRGRNGFLRFFWSCVIVFTPMGLIFIQPDFGTSLVFIPILITMTFVAGVAIRYVVFLCAAIFLTGFLTVLPHWQTYIMRDVLPPLTILSNIRFIGALILALAVIGAISLFGYLMYRKRYFYWFVYGTVVGILSLGASFMAQKFMKDYQIKRLIVFLNPDVDPRGAGWNIIQSITAIGSGGLWGKGYLQGTQSHYRFLPEQSTDFIFSIFSEEWGFLGGILVFTLFLLICFRMIRIMKNTPDLFGSFIISGIIGMYMFHFLTNVGMTMGIMPITGIPLLFMSYGGSALTIAMSGIGIALSIYIRRYDH